jgi:hypothetical protein
MAQVNKEGIYHIQDWINANQDYNAQVFNLWANGIASQINQCATLDDDLQRNGEFIFEVGLRDAQGHVMAIALDKQHFNIEQ